MKRAALLDVLLFFLIVGVPAQKIDTESVAREIDRFENTNCDDYRGRLDVLLIELDKSPQSTGYVYIYEGDLREFVYDNQNRNTGSKYVPSPKGTAKELIRYFKEHLAFRAFKPERLVFLEAGFRERFNVELWLTPNGTDPPKPAPTLKSIKQRKPMKYPYGFCGEM